MFHNHQQLRNHITPLPHPLNTTTSLGSNLFFLPPPAQLQFCTSHQAAAQRSRNKTEAHQSQQSPPHVTLSRVLRHTLHARPALGSPQNKCFSRKVRELRLTPRFRQLKRRSSGWMARRGTSQLLLNPWGRFYSQSPLGDKFWQCFKKKLTMFK